MQVINHAFVEKLQFVYAGNALHNRHLVFFLNVAFIKKSVPNYSLAGWVVEKNSSLNIQGQTNINSFQCDVTEYLKPDTPVYIKNDATKKLSFTNSCPSIDVKRFDCHKVYN